MVNRFLSTFGAIAIFALLVGFGGATPATKVKFPAKAIAEIPITHHFSQLVTQVGSFQGGSPPPLIGTMPPQAGIAITQITMTSLSLCCSIGATAVVVRVDGVDTWKAVLSPQSQYVPASVTIVPPLIVPPGASLQVGLDFGPGGTADLTITGYTLDPAYFGP